VYTSDQGFFLGDHGWYDKRLMYEESLRMPFLVRYPRAIKAGSVGKDLGLNIDFAPTFLDYAGVKAPAEMQGRSFRGVLEGKTPKGWRTSMYYRYWMHNDPDHHVPGHYGVRTKDYMLAYYYGKPLGMKGAYEPDTKPEWEFYDLRKDPREMRNLYSDPGYAGVIGKLRAELERLQQEVGDRPA
jgi:arylsulfatase A-like enzyme